MVRALVLNYENIIENPGTINEIIIYGGCGCFTAITFYKLVYNCA